MQEIAENQKPGADPRRDQDDRDADDVFQPFQSCFSDGRDISGGIFERNRLFHCSGDVLFSGGGVL